MSLIQERWDFFAWLALAFVIIMIGFLPNGKRARPRKGLGDRKLEHYERRRRHELGHYPDNVDRRGVRMLSPEDEDDCLKEESPQP